MRPFVPVVLMLAALGSTVPLAAARIVHVAPPPPVPPIPEPPAPPVPQPSPAAAPSPWPDAVRTVGRGGGQLLKAAGRGIKKGLSSPDTARTGDSAGGSMTRGPDERTRITGQTGAQVITGPNGTTLIGGAPQDEGADAAKRGDEERRRGEGEGMRGTADGFRAQADELERVANLPGQLQAVRASNLGIAKGYRASADNLDKANKLNGG
jgi:hypothetical protein